MAKKIKKPVAKPKTKAKPKPKVINQKQKQNQSVHIHLGKAAPKSNAKPRNLTTGKASSNHTVIIQPNSQAMYDFSRLENSIANLANSYQAEPIEAHTKVPKKKMISQDSQTANDDKKEVSKPKFFIGEGNTAPILEEPNFINPFYNNIEAIPVKPRKQRSDKGLKRTKPIDENFGVSNQKPQLSKSFHSDNELNPNSLPLLFNNFVRLVPTAPITNEMTIDELGYQTDKQPKVMTRKKSNKTIATDKTKNLISASRKTNMGKSSRVPINKDSGYDTYDKYAKEEASYADLS